MVNDSLNTTAAEGLWISSGFTRIEKGWNKYIDDILRRRNQIARSWKEVISSFSHPLILSSLRLKVDTLEHWKYNLSYSSYLLIKIPIN